MFNIDNEPSDAEIVAKIKGLSLASKLSTTTVLRIAEWGCKRYNRMHLQLDQPFPQYIDEFTFEDDRFDHLPAWASPILCQKSVLERVIWSDDVSLIRLKNSNRAVVAVEEEWK